MRIEVKAVPNAKKNLVKQDGQRYKVYLTAPAVDGKANKALLGVLAGYFDIKKNAVRIVRGETSRHKLVEVDKTV